jgi:polysaccharide biosynthesis/export protein
MTMNPVKPGKTASVRSLARLRRRGNWHLWGGLSMTRMRLQTIFAGLLAITAAMAGGCASAPAKKAAADPCYEADLRLPRELEKVSHPTYTIESPDILFIEATRVIPLPPYKVQPMDALFLNATGVPEKEPIQGIYQIEPDGTINLGLAYGGNLRVVDMTTPEIEAALLARIKERFKPEGLSVSASLAQSRGSQLITGQHLVRPDGTVGLGVYGSVYVAGMTIAQARATIEQHLSKSLYRPEISIDVFAFNSKYYYVITDFAGAGEQVVRLPATGNETVLDAIANIGGLSTVSSKRIWIARPAPAGSPDQILPVDWKGVTRRGHTGSNYQVLPGDRVFVMASPLSKTDVIVGKIASPIERVFGAGLLVQGLVNPQAALGGGN